MFSSRLPARLESNALARALQRARAAGRPLIDLTLTNPTRAGIAYPAELFAALSGPAVREYSPQPLGLRAARNAVADDYRRRGVEIDPGRIVLTSSTSEAYSLLFKLLCEPCGDSVLVPVPSYPLFDHLTQLDGVAARPYRLYYDGRWWVDVGSVDHQWDARTKAVLAVSPNNPTGSLLSPAELAALAVRCAARGAALILDEVFGDYELRPSGVPPADTPVVGRVDALCFRLGGLSKTAALPQLKLGWIALEGPDALVAGALDRLELICDTYLSVSTPVQVAAADLMCHGAALRAQILERVCGNHEQLRLLAARHPAVDMLNADGGWSAVIRVPSRATEEEMVLDLLESAAVVVHPGFFFDFPSEAYLIVSLLPRPEEFRAGVQRMLEHLDG